MRFNYIVCVSAPRNLGKGRDQEREETASGRALVWASKLLVKPVKVGLYLFFLNVFWVVGMFNLCLFIIPLSILCTLKLYICFSVLHGK